MNEPTGVAEARAEMRKQRADRGYQKLISEILEELHIEDVPPHWVEAYMRLEHGTLDSLTRAAFKREVREAVACVQAFGVEAAEKLALSSGL